MTHDALFGEIAIALDRERGTLTVSGPAVPGVVVRRPPGTSVEPLIPIGTRNRRDLTLTVNGTPAVIRPGKGRVSRRSYAVDVAYDGVGHRLVPDSREGSRLLRDGRRIGSLVSDGKGTASAEWARGADVRPVDAAVGYALAAAFGTGARPMYLLVAAVIADALP